MRELGEIDHFSSHIRRDTYLVVGSNSADHIVASSPGGYVVAVSLILWCCAASVKLDLDTKAN